MPYFSATFSEVYPIPMRQFLACSCSKTASEIFYTLTDEFISYWDMLSTPDPIPMSMTPILILPAIVAHAYNPDEQSLFTTMTEVVSGNPAKNWAILEVISPPPGCKLLPTAISWTSLGSSLARSQAALKAYESKYYGAVSLKSPLLAFCNGVLTAEQMTTSSGFLVPMTWGISWSSKF